MNSNTDKSQRSVWNSINVQCHKPANPTNSGRNSTRSVSNSIPISMSEQYKQYPRLRWRGSHEQHKQYLAPQPGMLGKNAQNSTDQCRALSLIS
jgi:hypothetical protein